MNANSAGKKIAMKCLGVALGICLGWNLATCPIADAADYVVYSIYKELDMGFPGVTPQKDYYINMGSANGLRSGATLEIYRRIATYDLLSEKLYRDVLFPIARVKVIHVENNAAVARLDKFLPADATPIASPRAIMLGDIVRPPED